MQLTPWRKIVLVIIAQVFEKFLNFYGTHILIIVLTLGRILSQMNPFQTLLSNFFKIYFNIILSSTLILPSNFFLLYLLSKYFVYIFLLFHMCYTIHHFIFLHLLMLISLLLAKT
jgi:hypothetical protein